MVRRLVQFLTAFATVALIFSVTLGQVAQATGVCYVNAGAVGARDGTSWVNAYANLQVALTNVACTEVWVEAGVYYPTSTTTQSVPFSIQPGVKVYGGFAGTETALAQRVPGHVSILSGDIDHNDTNTDGNSIDETAADIQGNNTYHVVRMDGTGASVINSATALDGFTITGGNANNGTDVFGGGLFCNGEAVGKACSPTLANLTFSGNRAEWSGAGLFDGGGSGGTSSPTLTNVTFTGNTAAMDGGAIYNHADNSGHSSPTISNATFSGNTAAGEAGAIYNDGSFSGVSSPLIFNATFSGNSAMNGGAITNDAGAGISSPILSNVILWGDTASVSQPEIHNFSGTPTISFSVVQFSGGSGGAWDTNLGTDGGSNVDADPNLGPLADNGGFDQTMALLDGSSAIDTGADFLVCAAADPRGVPRVQGAHCDMGAYERIPAHASLGSGYMTDVGVFRPSTGAWYVKNVLTTTFGLSGDDPLPFDYNGDGRSDVAVFRPSNASWYVQGQLSTFYGLAGDVPVPGDYNGDRTADVAVYRPSNSSWYIKNQFSAFYGLPGDIPVPGDYNGDGVTDIAVYRPSSSSWYVRGQFSTFYGLPGDIPVPGDYNGDGKTDIAVYRPSTNGWFIRNQYSAVYGLPGDVPVPGDYSGDGATDVAVYRPSTRGWFVRSFFSTAYGLIGDYPLPAPDTNADGDPYQ